MRRSRTATVTDSIETYTITLNATATIAPTVTVGDLALNEDASGASVAVTLLGRNVYLGETVTVTLGDGTNVDVYG